MTTARKTITAVDEVHSILCRVDNRQYVTAKRILRDYPALSAALADACADNPQAMAEAVAALVRLHKYLD